jgi:hypothetical protein
MATSSIRHVHVFQLATGREVRAFDAGDHLYNMHLVGRGTRLLLATPTRRQVWDWSIPKKLYDGPLSAEIPASILDPPTDKKGASKEASPPAGTQRRLAPGELPNQLRLLDVTWGHLLGRLQFPEPVNTERAVLSSDGRYALVGSPSDSVYIFRLPDPPARDRR